MRALDVDDEIELLIAERQPLGVALDVGEPVAAGEEVEAPMPQPTSSTLRVLKSFAEHGNPRNAWK